MTDDLLTEHERWDQVHPNGRRESRPFRECPHCSRYAYRYIRTVGLLGGETRLICGNCGYKNDD